MSEKDQLIEVDTFDIIEREKDIVNLDSIISFFLRRFKIIILSSSILFSFLFIKTIDEYINNPIYPFAETGGTLPPDQRLQGIVYNSREDLSIKGNTSKEVKEVLCQGYIT